MDEPSDNMGAVPKYRIGPRPENVREGDWLTLISCGTVLEADMVRTQLGGAGIAVFIPDENLMAVEGWGLNAYGYVRGAGESGGVRAGQRIALFDRGRGSELAEIAEYGS